jgi:hypothetical protein
MGENMEGLFLVNDLIVFLGGGGHSPFLSLQQPKKVIFGVPEHTFSLNFEFDLISVSLFFTENVF